MPRLGVPEAFFLTVLTFAVVSAASRATKFDYVDVVVVFRQEGGFAGIDKISVFDTEELPASIADGLRIELTEAKLANLTQNGLQSCAGADSLTFRLVIIEKVNKNEINISYKPQQVELIAKTQKGPPTRLGTGDAGAPPVRAAPRRPGPPFEARAWRR